MLDERQYRRVAQWLDGADIHLSGEELAAGREIRSQEESLGFVLEVRAPSEALASAAERMTGRSEQRSVVRRIFAVAGVAVAAGVVLGAAFLWKAPPRKHQPVLAGNGRNHVPIDVLDRAARNALSVTEMELLANDIDRLEAEIALASLPEVTELEIKAIRQELDEFWINDPLDEWAEGYHLDSL